MSFCFFVKDHQDLDHLAPVIFFLKKEYKILILLENENLLVDNRIKFLNNFVEVKLIKKQNKFINNLKYKLFKFTLVEKIVFFLINILSKTNVIKFVLKNHFLLKNNIKIIVYDHRPPHECKYIFLCKILKIKILSFPHGYHIFSEKIDFAESQKNRNIFDYYTVQAEFQKSNLVSLGISEKKIKILGCPRFDEIWIQNLDKIYKNLKYLFDNNNPVISIFLGHWKYGINRKETIKMLNQISLIKKFNIILNLHTRGTSDLELEEINILKKNKNILINNNTYHSSQIIDLSNIVIGVGTSVLLECITRGKIFYYLRYLQSYKTIFDKLDNHQLVKSTDDLIFKINNLRKESNIFLNYKSSFYNKYIKNNILSLEKKHLSFLKDIINKTSE